MAKLTYAANMSLDGWTEDAAGGLDWGRPDDELFAYITDVMHSAGTYLYGRRMYEALAVWETDPTLAARSELMAEYARIWQAAEKVVYSTTLEAPSTARTRLERDFDVPAVRALKGASTAGLLIGGPHLAAQAFAAQLIDEVQLFVWPIILGGRNAALPAAARVDLELLDKRRFGNDVIQLRYGVR